MDLIRMSPLTVGGTTTKVASGDPHPDAECLWAPRQPARYVVKTTDAEGNPLPAAG